MWAVAHATERGRERGREGEMYGQNLPRLSGTKPSDFVLGNYQLSRLPLELQEKSLNTVTPYVNFKQILFPVNVSYFASFGLQRLKTISVKWSLRVTAITVEVTENFIS